MRTIKFRAWDKKNNIMFFPSSIDGKTGEVIETVKHIEDGRVGTHEEPYHNDYVLMQFTGLLDKNGKEIYEGDILTGGQEVKWVSHFWTLSGSGKSKHVGQIPIYIWSQREIIGNIYETPDLLK